jgi:hypothetical protein
MQQSKFTQSREAAKLFLVFFASSAPLREKGINNLRRGFQGQDTGKGKWVLGDFEQAAARASRGFQAGGFTGCGNLIYRGMAAIRAFFSL